MHKTRAFVFAILMACAATGAFAAARDSGLAIGGEGSLYIAGANGLPTSGMLLLHLPNFPLMMGLGVTSAPGIGFTADWWFAHDNFSRFFAWYVGIGAYLSIDTGSDNSVGLGGRLPIGLQLWPAGRVLEVFFEVAPAVGVIFVPTGFDWHLQAALGLRVWI